MSKLIFKYPPLLPVGGMSENWRLLHTWGAITTDPGRAKRNLSSVQLCAPRLFHFPFCKTPWPLPTESQLPFCCGHANSVGGLSCCHFYYFLLARHFPTFTHGYPPLWSRRPRVIPECLSMAGESRHYAVGPNDGMVMTKFNSILLPSTNNFRPLSIVPIIIPRLFLVFSF